MELINQQEPPKSGILELTLNIAPVSLQSSNRRKREVRKEIRKVTDPLKFILTGDVKLEIEWYMHEKTRYESDSSPDVDNIVKPLLDAITGPKGIMVDDCQVQSVCCKWVDWSKPDQKVDIRIQFTPDLWMHQEGLVFVHIGDNLCFPLPAAVPEDARSLFVLVAQMSLNTKKNLEEDPEIDYYRARLILPLQRFYHKSRLRRFEVVDAIDILKGEDPSE